MTVDIAMLSEAMKRALIRLCDNYIYADGRSVIALERRGLAVSRRLRVFGETPERCSAPTELGRQARALLLKDNSDAG